MKAAGPLLAYSPTQITQWLTAQGREFGADAMDQLSRVTLGLQVWSRAQLYETLVDFFANHLNVAYAPDAETADKALRAKAALFAELGVEVHLCGDVAL